MLSKSAGILLFLLALSFGAPGSAEHETYYRYTVLGYVQDARGRPNAGVAVALVREKTGFSYLAQSDASGLYVVVARLGDESAGEKLRLRAGAQEVQITARFDPADHLRERGTRVDWVDGKPSEQPAAFAATLQRFLAD